MSTTTRTTRLPRTLMVGSIAVGLAAGSYGIAGAATGGSGSGSSPSTSMDATATQPATPAPPGDRSSGNGPP
ncbi:MAG TPA: hypothetical protein VFG57_00375, partial [Gaiella sp.]|nr:hypothetical protein [Gaiella sp.]